jgi:chaperonin GroEL (HSP60 family)
MGIDDLASKYMVEAGIIGLRRVDKGDLNRIAKLTGATVISTMATPDGE